nr:MAG TPA: hypothetical protein [Caudoviricetes sp.]
MNINSQCHSFTASFYVVKEFFIIYTIRPVLYSSYG